MGQKIVLSGVTFTDPSLPVLRDDPLLSSGSLVLVDFGHSLGGVVGVPTNGAFLPNMASSIAAGLIGSASTAPSIVANTAAPSMVVEKTGKGGLHAIKSKVGDTTATKYVVKISDATKAYLLANRTNKFYWSAWHRVTRIFGGNLPFMALADPAYTVNFLMNMLANGTPGGASTNRIGESSNLSGLTTLGNAKHQVAVNGGSGVIGSMTFGDLYLFGGGPSVGNATLTQGGSHILYRVYLEDLTVSGRTYQQVKELDDALYQSAFSPGGKFHGDTFSDPVATLP